MKYLTLIIGLLSICIYTSCETETPPPADSTCKEVLKSLDAVKLRTIQDTYTNIKDSMVITDNCLTISLAFSGCDKNHTFDLICDQSIGKSLPIVTNIYIKDNTPQLCQAVFYETYTFDLSPLKALFSAEKKIRLNFPDQDRSVVWEVR
jgi:hypothetical protein